MTKASDNEFPSVLLDEQASAPTTPATGFWRVYTKSDGLYIVDDAGAETGPFGGGGGGSSELVLIEEVTLGVAGTVTFSSIPSTYRDLLIRGRVRHDATAPTVGTVAMRVGNGTVDSGNNYKYMTVWANSGTSSGGSTNSNGTAQAIIGLGIPSDGAAGAFGIIEVAINDYTALTPRLFVTKSAGDAGATSQENYSSHGGGSWEDTASAIDIITFGVEATMSDLAVGSKLALYGVGIP